MCVLLKSWTVERISIFWTGWILAKIQGWVPFFTRNWSFDLKFLPRDGIQDQSRHFYLDLSEFYVAIKRIYDLHFRWWKYHFRWKMVVFISWKFSKIFENFHFFTLDDLLYRPESYSMWRIEPVDIVVRVVRRVRLSVQSAVRLMRLHSCQRPHPNRNISA